MWLVLGAELEQVRKNVACPQFGDAHYGSWGALRLNQRRTIKRMIETIKYLDNRLEQELRGGSNWYSTDERLPEDDSGYDQASCLVLVSGKVGSITLKNAIELAYYSKSEGWILEMWPMAKELKVSHWMPLPAPPVECFEG